ncbi:S-adenosyl-L-methionine-dependent methyltransferase [Lipomyces tetrasporus]|uniref:S-adenosyl-L-methionine-dependent methyltransferase n=1 Tax=Lipomyces tetrasporus TaxID=54092 RepID=A0AAD7QN18_9ASCO|nr:S-adenosyl-L-methionine-dependent methyltransferase [Lipomyces tetrasporus]KAJ8098058.1 S-adenosyl-L-methionine-dependent methyltransferase [Lipomyces tetrasporus]
MASDLATQNRAHFNQIASTYETDLEEGLMSLTKAIMARRDWIGVDWNGPVKVLDYACGTGVISRALAPYATELIGVDISEEMVAQYNAHAGALGSDGPKMSAVQGNLTERDNPPLEQFADARYFDFDLIIVGMALHHIDDPTYALTRLGERLKKRGVLFVIDNQSRHHPHSEGSDHLGDDEDFHQLFGADVMKTVRHTGFTQGALRVIFEQAGVGGNFDHVLLEEPIVIRPRGIKVELKLFFARGERV